MNQPKPTELTELEKTRMRADLEAAPWLTCERGNYLYEPAIMFKKVSAILSPTGKEEIVPAEIVTCKTCGKIPAWFANRAPGAFPAEAVSECN